MFITVKGKVTVMTVSLDQNSLVKMIHMGEVHLLAWKNCLVANSLHMWYHWDTFLQVQDHYKDRNVQCETE